VRQNPVEGAQWSRWSNVAHHVRVTIAVEERDVAPPLLAKAEDRMAASAL
jgi:hypothetical protein